MAEFAFSPPLQLLPNVIVHTLSEAVAYIQTCTDVRRPYTRAGILRAMLAASTAEQQRLAGKGFRIWAETEGLLLGDGWSGGKLS
jgi:hypothetical protein